MYKRGNGSAENQDQKGDEQAAAEEVARQQQQNCQQQQETPLAPSELSIAD